MPQKASIKYTIIDTPGILSTKGRKEDKKILGIYLFESGAIEAFNAICMVEKYDTVRLSDVRI